MKLVKKIRLTYTLQLLTGLYIGSNSDSIQIGGLDRSVIRTFKDGQLQPYIPGSSLKGKIRCLLEQVSGCVLCENDEVNELMGSLSATAPSRLIVRDAYLTPDSLAALKKVNSMLTEAKTENCIDRTKGIASNPRTTERVPSGAEFLVEMIINVWENDNEKKLVALLEKGIRLLENDYIGGSGSRGYGQVKFEKESEVTLSSENNWKA